MLSVKTTTLNNGLDVVTVEQPHLHAASVAVLVKCGSRHERTEQWGLSHLVEHMLFRGTEHFPDSRRLAQAFERHGGRVDAATWRDHTAYSTPIHPSRLEDAMFVLGDMVHSPAFRDLHIERTIVEEELQSDLDDEGQDLDINNVSRAAIWANHPMGRRIAGSFETLRTFDEDHVRHHHGQHYVARNAVLCVAGKVREADVLRMAEQTFGSLKEGAPVQDGQAARFSPVAPMHLCPLDTPQLEIQLTFEALPYGHPLFPALSLLSRVLDDGVSSRLQQALLEKQGLLYELNTGVDSYMDCGLYDIEMRVAPRRATTAIATTLYVLTELCQKGIRDEELELAKERSIHELEFTADSAEELAEQYAMAHLFGRALSLEEEINQIRQVSVEQLKLVADRLFGAQNRLHTTLMGPVHRTNMPRIEALLDGFSNHQAQHHDFCQPPGVGRVAV